MDRDRIQQIQDIFGRALERDPAERAAFLDRECAGDATLRQALDRLFDADRAAASVFQNVVRSATQEMVKAPDRAGLMLGPYRLLRELGRGGMGAVWLAERADQAYTAQVAIKLVHGGFAHPDLERRFRAERQILADLQHPNIARLLDGGDAPDGTPYIVMEFIAGDPITVWANRHQLDLRARLELFLRVCDAVQHAHGSLVVHRDIKPSNILVGDDGVPKLVDFGIAKPLAPGAGSETTALVRPMTPSYASPEQIRGERITVATDVYALGVLLYELFTGELPFSAQGTFTPDLQRQVLEQEARAPSTVLQRASVPGSASAGISARALAGDLDNIVLKALRKEAGERYGSVDQLSDDVRRHLAGQPVLARPATASYRLRKFVLRNRAGVATATAAMLTLIVFAAFHTTRLTRERDIANRERVTAEQVSGFLVNLFRSADPTQTMGEAVTADTLLAAGRQRLDTALAGEPAVRARLLAAIGGAYLNLGRFTESKSILGEALALTESTEGPASARVADILNTYSVAYSRLGHQDTALQLAARALPIREAMGDTVALAVALQRLGGLHVENRDYPPAGPLLARALALQEAVLGPNSAEVASTLQTISALRLRTADERGAMQVLERALAIRRALGAARRDPQVATLLMNMAVAQLRLDNRDSARVLYEQTIEIREAVFGPDHALVLTAVRDYANLLGQLGEYDLARTHLDRVLAGYRRVYGENHNQVANALMNIAHIYNRRGDYSAALPWYRQSIAVYEKVLPADNENLYYPINALAFALNDLSRYSEAEALLRRALAITEKAVGPDHPQSGFTLNGLGRSAAGQGRIAEARSHYSRAAAILEKALGPDHVNLMDPIENLAALESGQRNFAEAARLYERGLRLAEKRYAVQDPQLASYLENYARALRGGGDSVRASSLEQRARTIRGSAPKPGG
jgi:serine/threonine-protein kinase